MALKCFLLLVLAFSVNITSARRGYILTAPSRFIAGRPEKVCVDMIDVTTNVSVELSLFKAAHSGSSQSIDTPQQNLVGRTTFTMVPTETTRCVSMTVATGVTSKYLALNIRGNQLPLLATGWSFSGQSVVRMLDRLTPTEICLVQTDKPEYKPSQSVQIRILRLDTALRPINLPIDSITIRTPSGVSAEQWTNVAVTSGMAALQFQLADELEHGDWRVVVSEGGKELSKTFSVRDYELASFDVTISPPASVMLRDDVVTAEICAVHVYGQPVQGVVNGQVCLTQPNMKANLSEAAFCHNVTQQIISGCASITADRITTGWDYRYNDWRNSQLVFVLSVKQDVTGETVSAPEAIVPFTNSPYVLNFEGSDSFKPGLPYHAKVRVTTISGEAASAQLVTIVVDNTSTGQPTSYSKVYSTDARGMAFVTIPPFIGHSLLIEATLKGSMGHASLTARLNPKASYSPSGSFLQIVPLTESSLLCGSNAQYRVQYTTSSASNVIVLYKVVGVGDISASFQQPAALTIATLVSAKDPAVSWDSTSSWQTTPIQPNTDVAARPIDPTNPVFNPAMTITTATHKGSFTVSFPVTSEISPKGHLVVYYARATGEVVSDSIALSVPECTNNRVSLSLSRDTASPGQTVQLNLAASPGAVCGYSMVERNTFTHSKQNYPTLASIARGLETYLLPTVALPSYLPVNFYCGRLHGIPSEYPGYASYWQAPTMYKHRDAQLGFVSGGLVCSSTLLVRTAPCKRVYYKTHAAADPAALPGAVPATAGQAAVSGQLTEPAALPAVSAVEGNAVPVSPEVMVVNEPPAVPNRNSPTASAAGDLPSAGPRPQLLQFVKDVNSFFPETMLFDVVNINAVGTASVAVSVPDTTTQWIGTAVCTDEEDGLGISTPVTLTAFHPYVVTVKLPTLSAVRGEIIPVEVSVTNYLTACLAVNLVLQPSLSFLIIGQLMLATEPSLCICGGGTTSRTFNLFLKDIGDDIPISITANSVNNPLACPVGSIMSNRIGLTETVEKSLEVLAEGVPRHYTYGDYICVDTSANASALFTKDYRLPRPSSRSRVTDSTIGKVSVIGDVMGPVIAQLDNLIAPAVGGEANMVTFAPSAFVLTYLDASRQQLSSADREKALQNLRSGYQRQLTYAHADGSYSWFGPNQKFLVAGDEPSLWLTAYVLKAFGHAKSLIHIDSVEMEKSLQYIVSKQDSWGCFPKVGRLPNIAMSSAVDSSMGDNYALTAYIIVAMMEAGYDHAAQQSAPGMISVVDKALECIYVRSRRLRNIRDSYTLALVAYSFALHDPADSRSVRAFRALRRQQNRGRDGHMYWRAMRDSTRVRTGNFWYNRPSEIDVEATSYGLLTTLIMANSTVVLTNGFPTVLWLHEERRARGQYGTSQDSVMAIQALAEYGKRFAPQAANVNLTVHFTRTVNRTRTIEEQAASFGVTTATRLAVSSTVLPRIRTLAVSASGTGCLRFQASVKYNVIAPDSTGQPYATTVTVRNNTRLSQLCQRKPLLVCTNRVRKADDEVTVMELRMQTGWQVEKSLVKQLLDYPSLRVKRFDISPKTGALTLHFSSLSTRRICFFVYTKRIASVRNGQPAVVTTYDYYKRDARQETTYHITC